MSADLVVLRDRTWKRVKIERWSAKRKAALIKDVRAEVVDKSLILAFYQISEEEYSRWETLYDTHGVDGFKAKSLRVIRRAERQPRPRLVPQKTAAPIKWGIVQMTARALAPLPWRAGDYGAVEDADGHTVLRLATRINTGDDSWREITTLLAAAPEMHAVLLAIDELFSGGLEGSPVMEEIRAVLDRINGAS